MPVSSRTWRVSLEQKTRQGLRVSLACRPSMRPRPLAESSLPIQKEIGSPAIPLVDEIVLVTRLPRMRLVPLRVPLDPGFISTRRSFLHTVRAREGRGTLEESFVTTGEFIIWIDTDIVNIHPRFCIRVARPDDHAPRDPVCEGFYRRPSRLTTVSRPEGEAGSRN